MGQARQWVMTFICYHFPQQTFIKALCVIISKDTDKTVPLLRATVSHAGETDTRAGIPVWHEQCQSEPGALGARGGLTCSGLGQVSVLGPPSQITTNLVV